MDTRNPSLVCINFGWGNSSHTWRDWGHLLRVLAEHLKPGHPELRFTVWLRDIDFDNNSSYGPADVVFKAGRAYLFGEEA